MKKVIALVLSLVMVLGLLAGCGNKQNDSDKKNDGKDYSNVKIGVMLSGSANDGGWSQMAADAAKAASKDYPGSTVNYSESISATDFETRQSQSKGFLLTKNDVADIGMICGGAVTVYFQFLDAAKLVSKEYPNITFICTSAQSGQEPNLTGIDFATYQLGFLNGAACAMATKTKKIGAVGSNEIDSIIAWCNGVIAGAKYIDPECEVFPVYTGSFDDALKAKQAVDALQQKGVDIVTQNADACGVGAVQECDALGLMNVGAVSDQTTIGESCFISVIQDAQLGITAAIEQAVEGTLKPGFVSMGASVGVITLTGYAGKYADVLSKEQKATLQDLWQKSYDGVDLSTLVG